jgi:uncharacterized membrane-anchored protein YjiN (DUF445 family)
LDKQVEITSKFSPVNLPLNLSSAASDVVDSNLQTSIDDVDTQIKALERLTFIESLDSDALSAVIRNINFLKKVKARCQNEPGVDSPTQDEFSQADLDSKTIDKLVDSLTEEIDSIISRASNPVSPIRTMFNDIFSEVHETKTSNPVLRAKLDEQLEVMARLSKLINDGDGRSTPSQEHIDALNNTKEIISDIIYENSGKNL